ncbi:MAG: tRNA lysidine(34) synthetase TilS [Parasporobacterium sp.]|nr:tRNA lysidine(34) synthetase TilS [Parasporobacterium sp.]
MADIYRTFCDYITENQMIQEEDHVIAGVSGGADSICLLLLLHQMSEELRFRLTAVHVNHRIRGGEADEDEAFVKDFCKERKIPCVAVKADVPGYAKEHGLSLEEAGRIARYQTFYQVARKLAGSDEIPGTYKAAVAHHRDDNAETILLNLVRGTGLKGLQGMQPVAERFGITVVRPMLCMGRKEIEAYVREQKAEFRTDSTNSEDEFSRNKIRLRIIPQLQEINSKASEHINEAACAIIRAQEFIEREARRFIKLMVDEREDGYYINLTRFSELDTAVKEQVVRDIIEEIAGSLKDVGRVHIESVLGLEYKQTGRRVELPYRIMAARSYGNLILRQITREDHMAQDMTDYARGRGETRAQEEPEEEQAAEPEEFIIDPTHLPAEPVRFWLNPEQEIELALVHVNPVTRQQLIEKNEYTKAFDCAKIKGNLTLRKPDPHEEIQFFGGRKTIRKFLVDEKVPREERDRIMVLSDEENIMWIIGYRMSELYKISEMTNQALQVSIIGGEDEQH